MGRPKAPQPSSRFGDIGVRHQGRPTVTVRLEPELREACRALATADGENISEWLRRLVKAYVEAMNT